MDSSRMMKIGGETSGWLKFFFDILIFFLTVILKSAGTDVVIY